MTNNKDSLNDFFNSIGGEKKKIKEEKNKIIGDLSLDNLFSSMEEESRKIKEEKKQLKKDVEAFKNLLFKEEKKEEKPSVDEYIEPPRPEEEIADAIRQSETNKEETVVEHAVKILDKINEEVETVNTEPDLAKLKKEIEVLKQVVYEQGGGGEVRLEFLDDVDRDSVKVDGKFLKYQSSTGKFIGADASGGGGSVGAAGTWAVDSVGINTSKSVGIGADAVSGIKLNVAGKVQLENEIKLKSDDGTPARIDLYCEVSNAHYLRLQAPAHSAFSGNPTVVLPNSAGTIALTSSNITGTSAGLSGTPNISVGTISGTTITGSSISVTNVTASGVSTFTNNIQLKSGDGDPARVDFYCESGNSHYTRLKSAPHSEYSGNVSIVLPIKSGDIIVGDTSGNITQNINTSGIITATSFIGNVTGNVTGNATGLTGTPSISVVDITSRHINSSGVVTATSFVGDGSGLTGLSGGVSGISTTGTSVFNQLNVSGVTTFRDTIRFEGSAGQRYINYFNFGRLQFNNNVAAAFGNSSQGRVQHDGTHLKILNNASDVSGNIIIQAHSGEDSIIANQHGSIELYHNDSKKFETTNTGAKITGDLEVTGELTYEDVTRIDSVGLITARSGMVVSGVSTFLGSQKGINVVGVSTFAGNVNLPDNDILQFGDSQDLKIYHDSTQSIIADTGTGQLAIRGGVTVSISNPAGTQVMANFINGGAVNLFHAGVNRFKTTSTGAVVTGILTATSFSGDLTGDVTGNADTATALATARTIGGVSFDGSANINLPGVNTSGNQDTSGNASTATVATNAQGLTGTPNIAVGNITVTGDLTVEGTTNSQTSTDTTVTGILTATSINVGSTATGIGVTLDQGGGVYSGIITATSFVGALTGTASGNPTLANGANNRIVTATGANALTGESGLTFDGTTLLNAGTGFKGITIAPSTNNSATLRLQNSQANYTINNVSGGSFSIADGSGTKFTINSSGTVGINNDLEVTSGVKVGSAVTVNSTGVDAGAGIVTATKFSGNTAQGGGNDSVFQMNGMTVTQDFEFPDGQSAMSVGPITINSGVEVTVPDGQNWVIL